MVPGDIPPKLVPQIATSIAPALCSIFNCVAGGSPWPTQWKTEFQTVIPKKASPESLNDCRNLSCTNFFSKVLESFVLERLLHEVPLSDRQFGGMKGCGTNHFLLTMWQNILEGLEEEQSAVSLMSIDFSKAFNRMSHQACLASLAQKKCSNQSIRTYLDDVIVPRSLLWRGGTRLVLPSGVRIMLRQLQQKNKHQPCRPGI